MELEEQGHDLPPEEVVEEGAAEVAETPDDPPDVPEGPDWSEEDENEARLFGWKPATEWKGDLPDGFAQTPDEFLERLQSSRIFKTMQDKLTTAEKTAQETTRRMEAMNARALERQRAAYEAEVAAIAEAQRRAVETADTAEWDRQEERRKSLQPPAQAQTAPQGPDPYVEQYAASEQGQWLSDPLLKAEGAALIDQADHIKRLGAQQQIEYAEAQLRAKYPHKFAQPEQPRPTRPKVDPGGLPGTAISGGSAFTKLPREAQEQFKRFVKEGLFKDSKEDREEFANDFNAA